MKKMKKIGAILLTAVMVCSLAACGGSSGNVAAGSETSAASGETAGSSGKTELNVGQSQESSTMDPAFDSSGTSFTRAGIGQSLMICNTEGELVPWIADSITTEDSVKWTVTIKDGIQFSNGNACDAAAVQASLEHLIENNAGLSKSLNIASMEADGNVLTITCNDVTVDLLSYLSHPQSAIQDMSAEDIENAPVGTGPYKIDNFIAKQELNLSKNEYYWNGDVAFETVNYYMNKNDSNALWLQLQSGELDMVVNPSSTNIATIQEDPDSIYKVAQSDLTTRDRYLIYNMEGKYTSDVNFRKGIDHLIDRETIVDSIMGGLAIVGEGCVPADYEATPDYIGTSYDVDEALKYFEAAGLTVKDGMVTDNGETITLKYHTYSSFAEMNDIVQLIQASLASVGINAEVTSTADDIDDYLGNVDNVSAWDISMASMFAVPRGDAAYILNTSFDVASQYNYTTTRVADDELQNLIDSIRSEGDSAARTEMIKEAALRVEDMCYISYYMNPTFQIVYNSEVIDNVTAYGSEQYFVNDAITVK